MNSSAKTFTALVIGASGGIGSAIADSLRQTRASGGIAVLNRAGDQNFDLTNEASIEAAAAGLGAGGKRFDLVFDATGALELAGEPPEKSLSQIDASTMAQAFAVNAIGPALLFKHFSRLLPPSGRCVFATLSARVGSISDNHLGGWYSYRASKAALNQIVKTAAIEIARKRPDSICVALHPGTVETPLSRSFARGRFTHTPTESAQRLIELCDALQPSDTGGFFAYDGTKIDW